MTTDNAAAYLAFLTDEQLLERTLRFQRYVRESICAVPFNARELKRVTDERNLCEAALVARGVCIAAVLK